MKTFIVTLFNRWNPKETREEDIEARTAEEAEQYFHDRYFDEGWGVLDSYEYKEGEDE